MPATVSVTLGDLIEETLDSLYRANERPAQVVIGANALVDDADTLFTLSSGVLSVTDLVESPTGEKMLVTAKSDDATPVYTVSRGYQATTKDDGLATGTILLKNPTYGRAEVTRWLNRSLASIMNTELPYWTSAVYNTVDNGGYIIMPANTIKVFSVRFLSTITNRIADVGGWQLEEMPTALVATGRALRVHSGVTDEDDVIVDAQFPYEFSDATEDGTINLPIAARDVPVLWATAYALSRRQVSRTELDKIEEWNQDQAIRAGVSLRAVRDTWGEVYRRIDEAKRIHRVPKHRPYRKMAEIW